ncbi:UDP-N-acetylglucosamine diphosphorylase/glucosamine-1-phosphate N-acetyltransferase [Pseudomonas abyssi]|jgi:bifunctional UDP-N-acetylglucosamine pyrophosphorylase/glucosamine-1-phosphate N-acetyltransferase|uniref:Bifunctional protein GlmU n=1 Tax=Pseudomonas abyssi TaxID=170540 RepID=A0A2A3MHI1_9PSED|nr:bifunctional UDP-N-acetylglucosamine diphosphorylase/glucosamine-1-phosphate N-acetyltransferase GlmU [Pseudomonas abyssi]MAC99438.1 UDP-N-acetylglucosamine diphosphorylase/glucosamine-1-phosphate N-acetyltransferase [Pseudomonadales bacterium]PBK04187.1 UDP-N-acetylglucosamine diphosphorylase/glucosamine-1-phosphate N-acetyltransferase [Pseudomonas abyssi]|tara:strand:+ start:1499 stop:2860 length:1362 start_codon:yes stop_codon:yes gene_type:complete
MNLHVVILAAGQGTRMRSKLPKVLHPVAGKPMLGHVIDCARSLSPTRIHVVIGHGAELVRERLAAEDIHWVLQTEQLGTGHAVAQALPGTEGADQVLVLYGDVPLLRVDTLQQLSSQAGAQALGMLTVTMADPTGYGRIVRDAAGQVQAIVEQKDASAEQLAICEGNTGIMALPGKHAARWLGSLSNQNAQGEYYLTDVVAMAVSEQIPVEVAHAVDEYEVLGANNRVQLAVLEAEYRRRQAERLMTEGVSLADPARIDVRGDVRVGRDISIDINVVLEGHVVIEDDVIIEPNCVLRDCHIGAGSHIKAFSHIDGAELASGCDVGPYARLRPGTRLQAGAKIGNFVETKKADIGAGAKVNHLSYIGDAVVGPDVNIGAGTITCNYDGVNKHLTTIEEGAFIGTNTALVAPVTIGARATTAAGSTITTNVPADTLAVSRARQRNIDGWKHPTKS